ncbi:MAG: hypothetical protein Q8O59_04900 [bacterium]|nr:hypothetical protein [bacterium]
MKFRSKKIYSISFISLFLIFFFVTNFCLAAFLKPTTKTEIEQQANVTGVSGGYDVYGGSTIFTLIQTVINALLSLIGVILLAYILYAGYNWMTAQGEEEKVTKAKDTLKRAIIGVIIIVAAYAISVFVMSRLEAGTLRGGNNTTATPSPIGPLE